MIHRPSIAARHLVRGASAVELAIVVPTLLLLALAAIQIGMALQARLALTLAANEAARAGSVGNASLASLRDGLARGLTGYYAGGSSAAALLLGRAAAAADLALASKIEIVSPTRESFDDHASSALQQRLGIDARVIPVSNVALKPCQADAATKCDPANNASGQTLADATLLKVRVVWGLPSDRQVPLAGKFWIWALTALKSTEHDAFRQGLVEANRIPLEATATIRMQSPPIENEAMRSDPGPGNAGQPVDTPLEPSDPLPSCPVYDPACVGVPPEPDDANEPPFCPGY